MFDIPETNRYARERFTIKIRELGMQLLQQSVWIHPYPCLDEITTVALNYSIEKYLTYIETNHIDNEKVLIERFQQTLVI